MVTYKAEVLAPAGWSSAPVIAKHVQAKLDAFTKTGWRLHGMTSVAGTGGMFGGTMGSFLVLVFEHD